MYLYETHLHTAPVSRCAKASVRETLEFYKKQEYAGVFITNHFLDGNVNVTADISYAEKLAFFFSDYYEGVQVGKEIDLPVFLGLEMSYKGTDFLVYGVGEEWFLERPTFLELSKRDQLTLLAEAGALIIQAHPYREASYIDHIRLFPRHVHGVETYNANRTDFENHMAEMYAKAYELLPFAGSDNHLGPAQKAFGGIQFETPLVDEQDFIERVKAGKAVLFRRHLAE